jgi:3-deoxy-D-manno-octulosonic-acid transferase
VARSFMYFLYRLVLAAAFPFVVIYLLTRAWRDRRYLESLPERLGRLPSSLEGTGGGAIWLHAVSVGEVLSSLRLIERLRAVYPERNIFVSSTTLAGKAVAEEKFRNLADGVFYAPVDYCFAVRAVLRRLRPSLVVVLETEIWPNLYRETKRTHAGLLIVNGRISDRAMPRYRRAGRWLPHALAWPDAILAQNEVAAQRYRELGAPPERVRVAGNLKYDFDPAKAVPPEAIERLLRRTRPEPVWVAASTMPPAHEGDIDEDDTVLEAFRALAASNPRLLLILAPRRPERFAVAAAKLKELGAALLRRSELAGEEEMPLPGVLLLDTIGELSSLFRFADVVFLGGTLAERGGHNLLEPAFFGRPIVTGPHLENFPDIAEEFRECGAMVEIRRPEELARAVGELIAEASRRSAVGTLASQLAERRRGATERALEEIRRLSDVSVRRPVKPLAVRALLWPLSLAWGCGVQWRQARALARRKTLRTPVISVGGIAMGGAGKTPCVLYLTERLQAAGWQPGILTRGYRRHFPAHATILPPGARASTGLTGDEAQLFLRSGLAPVGIGADRYAVGRLLEEHFHPDLILLDDGFQHWRLERSLDLVLIDAQNPFGGEALFPLGRLREPVAALERADLLLLTRADPGLPLAGIEARLREVNARAPIFRSRVVPLEWVNLATGERAPAECFGCRRAAAFCGLANPGSFWQTLASLRCRPVFRWEFPDHHHYRPRELRHLAAHAQANGAEILLTTEKDVMNLPAGASGLPKLYWLRIGLLVDDEEGFLAAIQDRLRIFQSGKPERKRRGS